MTDLEIYTPRSDSPTEQALALIGPASAFVETICKTNFVPAAYRGKPAEALACVLTGEMLGLHPLVSLREIDVIQGTPAYSAKMQRALVQRAGHRMWLEDATATKVTMAGHRKDDPEHVTRVVWTIDRAKTMGLTGKDNWRKQPQSMLIARATGELARLIAADELLGLAYNAEEVRDGTASDEDVVEAIPDDLSTEAPEGVAPAPKPDNVRRLPTKKAAAKKAAARPPASAAASAEDPVGDFDDIDQGPVEPQGKSTSEKRTAMVAIQCKEVLGEISREDRLAFLSASTGRALASSKDLTSADVDRVLVALAEIKAGRAEWSDGELVHTPGDDEGEGATSEPAADLQPAGDNEWADLDADDWLATVKDGGVRQADVLRNAAVFAGEMGVKEPPTSIRGLADADPALKARVGEWIRSGGQ